MFNAIVSALNDTPFQAQMPRLTYKSDNVLWCFTEYRAVALGIYLIIVATLAMAPQFPIQ